MTPDFIQRLQQKLQLPLPGLETQKKMAHSTRQLYATHPERSKKAGVLATLFLKNGEWQILFIERSRYEKGPHGGQIAFPGGKYELEDRTLLDTALREAQEEVGINRNDVRVLGNLTSLYIPVSNFEVHAFVGYLEYQPDYKLQPTEVMRVLEVPFSYFKNPSIRRSTSIPIGNHLTLNNVPYFDVYGKVLWGATAMLLNELMEVAGSDA